MSTLGSIHYALWFLALCASAWVYRSSSDQPLLERLIRASLPVTAFVLVWHWIADIAVEPVLTVWSGIRLAPSVALLRGMKVYEGENQGPIIGWIYPPGSLLAYLPAAWIKNIPAALITGRCLSLFYFYGPVLWILLARRDGENQTAKSSRWLVLVTFGLVCCSTKVLRYCSTEIHSDAPALGLAALSLIVMSRSRSPRGQWAAIGLATLSVWAKQLTIPILAIALPIWAYRKGGMRGTYQFIAASAVITIFTLILFVTWFDAGDLFFNILTIPLRHPGRFDSFFAFDLAIVKLQQSNLYLGSLFLIGILGLLLVGPNQDTSVEGEKAIRPKQHDDRWLLFLILTLAEAPFAVMAYAKAGGDDNNLAFALYFFAITTMLLVERLLAADGEIVDDGRPRFAMVLVGMNIAISFVMNQQLGLTLGNPPKAGLPARTSWTESRQAEDFIRTHRGKVYFPWNPLEHLVVEDKLYHFEYGVFALNMGAWHPITEEHFFRYIPDRTDLVCYPLGGDVANEISMRYLKDFVKVKPLTELPDWTCYARPGSEFAPRELKPETSVE